MGILQNKWQPTNLMLITQAICELKRRDKLHNHFFHSIQCSFSREKLTISNSLDAFHCVNTVQ